MRLEHRLVTARILAGNLKHAIEDDDLHEARHMAFHLRRKLRQAGRLLDQLELMLGSTPDRSMNNRRQSLTEDDLP